MDLRGKRIFKREDGSRVKVEIEIFLGFYSRGGLEYRERVSICGPRKRTWHGVVDADSYDYRKLSMDDREEYEKAEQIKYISASEILSVKRDLWERIEPK